MKSTRWTLAVVFFKITAILALGQDATVGLIDSAENARAVQAAWAAKLNKPIQWTNPTGMKFQLIPPGEFDMGVKDGDKDAPLHRVRLTEPFYLGTYEVTREEWEKITKHKQSNYFPGARQPINYIKWYDSQNFLAKLNKAEGITNSVAMYRFPTEAEWEYAARAGTKTRYYTGDTEADLDKAGWYEKNSGGATHPVGEKAPNAFGLYDMLGNVWEWCGDFYDPEYYTKSPPENPPGQKGEYPYEYTILRGGSFAFSANFCTTWHRDHSEAERTFKHIGLRVALPIKP